MENALRRFKRRVSQENIIEEIKRQAFYLEGQWDRWQGDVQEYSTV